MKRGETMNLKKLQLYAPHIPRIALGVVFLVFGLDKFRVPEFWIGFMPTWLTALLPFSAALFNYAQAAGESVLGVLLLMGRFTRSAAALCGVLLAGIVLVTFSTGLYDLAVRDIGLLGLALYVMLMPTEKLKKEREEI